MATNPVWEICERMAEVQALLHDHAECGKHTPADVVAKAQAVLSEPELLRPCSMSATSRRTRYRSASRFHDLLSSRHASPRPAALPKQLPFASDKIPRDGKAARATRVRRQ